MNSIKQKLGVCVDCSEQGDNTNKPLVSKRCQSHYWQYRASLKVKKPKTVSKSNAIKKAGDTTLGKWFEHQISICPNSCEECGENISRQRQQGGFWATALIAHILPKAKNKFPEVATHENNRMFFCDECHHKYDNRGNEYRKTMKSLPLLKERLKTFYFDLSESQRTRAERYLPFTENDLK